MDVRLRTCFLAVDDHDRAIAFYRDTLGMEVRNDVSAYGMRWVTLGSAAQPGVDIVLEPPAADPGISPTDRAALDDLLAKGLLRGVILATTDLEGAFDRIQASGVEILQEPMDQPWGARDFAFRDPAGNLIRMSLIEG